MADPFDALRQLATPAAPNPAFAAQLRRRLADLLDPTPPGGSMAITDRPTAARKKILHAAEKFGVEVSDDDKIMKDKH